MTAEEAEELTIKIVRLHVAPLAQIITQLSAMLVRAGTMTTAEVEGVIASGVRPIQESGYSHQDREDAASLIKMMLDQVSKLPSADQV